MLKGPTDEFCIHFITDDFPLIYQQRPAQIRSLAVVNLAGNRNRCAYDFTSNFFKLAESHGLELPDVDPRLLLDSIISHTDSNSPTPHEVRSCNYSSKQFFELHVITF